MRAQVKRAVFQPGVGWELTAETRNKVKYTRQHRNLILADQMNVRPGMCTASAPILCFSLARLHYFSALVPSVCLCAWPPPAIPTAISFGPVSKTNIACAALWSWHRLILNRVVSWGRAECSCCRTVFSKEHLLLRRTMQVFCLLRLGNMLVACRVAWICRSWRAQQL